MRVYGGVSLNRYRTRSRAQPGMEVAKGTAMETPPQPPRSPRARRTTTPPPAAPPPPRRSATTRLAADAPPTPPAARRPGRRSAEAVLPAYAAPAGVEAASHAHIARRAYEISQWRAAG